MRRITLGSVIIVDVDGWTALSVTELKLHDPKTGFSGFLAEALEGPHEGAHLYLTTDEVALVTDPEPA